ncbi:aminotransferase class I/II-fold pyridoxal phosphate-dependent enzyme [Leisingera sp. XS_AS12]|uniref:aminotransferase class I/II-fold pyridoxal phosphate-dependent enzyme n=1 Tax=Leisingera sp. XS_AS12 TaxID=3241294 RepID=UPI0035111B03
MAQFRRARRLDPIGVSEILTIGARAAEMKRQGAPVIILGAGEPDFDTPEHIKTAAAAAMQAGETKYTALGGSDALKQAVREKFRRDNVLCREFPAA